MNHNLLELPKEVLEIILSLLTYQEKIQCRPVCSKFKDIVDHSFQNGLHCIIDENSTQSLHLAKNARIRIAKFRCFSSTTIEEKINKEDKAHFLAYPQSLKMAKIIGPIDYYWFSANFLPYVRNSLKKIVFQGAFLTRTSMNRKLATIEIVPLPNLRILEVICIDTSSSNNITELGLTWLNTNLCLILSTIRSRNLELLYIYDFDLTNLEPEFYRKTLSWRDVPLRKFLDMHKITLQTLCLPTYIGNIIEERNHGFVIPRNLIEYELLLNRSSEFPYIIPSSLMSIFQMNHLKCLRLSIVKFPTSTVSNSLINLPNTLSNLELYIQIRPGDDELIIDASLFSCFKSLKKLNIVNWAMNWGWNEEPDFQNDNIKVINLTSLPSANLEILSLRKISISSFQAESLKPYKKLAHVALGPINQSPLMEADEFNSYKIVQMFLKMRKLQTLILFFRAFEPSCKQIFKELLRNETTTRINLKDPNLSIFEQCASILCSKNKGNKLYRLWDTIGLGLQNYFPKQVNNISLVLGIQIDHDFRRAQNISFKPATLRDQLSYKFDVKGFLMKFGDFGSEKFNLSNIVSNVVMRLSQDYTTERSNTWPVWS